jgi:hypothetical protein
VTDRLLSPKVDARSEAAFPISESDLVSYILFDAPGGLDLLGQDRSGLATSLFAPIATSATSELIRKRFVGRYLDQFQLQTLAVDPTTGLGTSVFNTTRFTGGKAFGPLFVSLNSGFCTFDQKGRGSRNFGESFYNQLGGNFEYRLRSSLTSGASWQLAAEPATENLVCGGAAYNSTLGIAPTPRQYSLAFLKFWRW